MSEPLGELHPGFSSPGATARPWSDVDDTLTSAKIFWLSTVRTDGRPHVTPLPAVWTAGSLHFCTGPAEQKAVNLRANPNVVLTTGTDKQDEGLDVMVEGKAVKVTGAALLTELARLWKERLNWDYEVVEGGFRQDEEHTAYVFGVAPAKVLAFGKGEPYSQTRFRLG
ncbi:pyridoxamine 5'-phosphate oxidase family protein [Actinoplanes bogorensis]|uniref:Pyridoxamine 5'-phosphate oxidase family protein n=1 Tax=Paractinoplanes bogorensis TaxID=1610840 RepID=A0ABS5YNC2_9ACTN|nr:pyridoxamine 5'-phosphate oxidase family protein [Actinoplanes bogorensis]MBU2664536.1 pyridoxamine 5'-phosphate oxidase family protein [Actinoplanes bogorensis]